MRGNLITFEGIEGSGKTSQIKLLEARLRGAGRDVLSLREPGGTPLGDVVRGLLLGTDAPGFCDLTEAYLFATSRAELTRSVIQPALEAGTMVLCDRFVDSSVVYQGIARGLGVDVVEDINRAAVGDCSPDLTFLLDLPAETGLGRALDRSSLDRIEGEELGFHQAVRQGFVESAHRHQQRFVVLDATPPVQAIHQEMLARLQERLPEALT